MYLFWSHEGNYNREYVAASSEKFEKKNERRLGMRAIAQRNSRGQVRVLTLQFI